MFKKILIGVFSMLILVGGARAKDDATREENVVQLTNEEKANLLLVLDHSSEYLQGVIRAMEALLKKAQEDNDLEAQKCLKPLLSLARELEGEAESLKVGANKGISSDNYSQASENVKRIQIIRNKFEKLLEQALACLGDKLIEGESILKLIPPPIKWSFEDVWFVLPEPAVDPEKFISIYL
jgi:hypothetical protein